MGSLLKTVGFGGANDPVVKRSTGILSDGSSVMMVADMNQAGVTGDGGDNTGVPKFYFYHSTDRVTWTLKATVNMPGAMAQNTVASMVVDSANNIHLAYRFQGAFVTVYYVKLTFSAGPTWAVGANFAVNTAAPAGYTYMSQLDIDMIGNSTTCLVIGSYWYQTTGAKKTAVVTFVQTTGGTWNMHAPDVMINGDSHLGYADDFTISADNVSVIGGDNVGLYTYHAVRKAASGTDFGDVLQLVRVNCSTGARIATHTIYSGRFAGVGGGFRKFWLFNTAANQWDLAGVVDSSDFKTALYRFSWNRTSNAYTSHVPISLSSGRVGELARGSNNHNWCAVVGNGIAKYMFFGIGTNGGAVAGTGKITNDGRVVFEPGWLRWDDAQGERAGFYSASGRTSATVAPARQIFAGATRNLGSARLDAMIFYFALPVGTGVANYRMEARSILAPLAPWGITPAAGSTVSTDRPIVSANFKMATYYPQLKAEMEWAIASDAGFTTNLRTVTEEGTDFVAASGTTSPYNSVVNQTELLTAIEELSQGTWYIRARSVDWSGNYGPWSSSQSFVVTHPPVGADLYPTGGAVFLYAGVGNVSFAWKFTDPSPYDNQTAYRIAVERTDDGSAVANSGKVSFSKPAGVTANTATLAIPASGKDVELRWKLTLWDSDDVMGPETPYQVFYVAEPPAPTFTAPTPDEVITTGIPTISWSPGLGGTKTQTRYRVFVTQGSNVLYNSNWIDSVDTSHTIPVGYLSNGQSYTFRLEVQDNLGLQGSTEVAVSTDWVEPLGPADNWEVFVHEYPKRGFVYITWTDENMDPDFTGWNVYRRLVGEASWTQVGTYTTGAGRYAHRDYFIGSGRTYEYTITQLVDRFGDYIESIPSRIVRVTPDADNYWLIDPLQPENSIPLYQVTSEPFTEEYEQETTHILGAGRYVEYGDRLGYTGSLSSQLRDKFVSGAQRENYVINPSLSFQSSSGAVPDGWELAVASETTAFADTFTRTVANGLGSGWTTSGGAASNYSVDGSKAVISMTAKGVDYYMIPTMTSLDDFDVTFLTSSPDMTADAGSNNPQISAWVRYVDSNNNLRVKIWLTSGGMTVNLTQRIGGVETTSVGFPPVTGTTINSQVWMRIQGAGEAIKVAGWANGGSQDPAWHVEFITTLLSPGGMRFSGVMPAGYSGTTPKTVTLDNLTIKSLPTLGEVSQGYYETRNPSPTGKTPYRVSASGIGTDSADNIRLENTVSGSDYPDKMKVTGTTVVLSAWVAVSSINSNKRYRLSVSWMDASGSQLTQVDSAPLDPAVDGVDSYIPLNSPDVSGGNVGQVWRRLRLITTVPSGAQGAVLKVRLMGNSGVGATPGELIVGGVQFETLQMTDYFDGDQFGSEWSGVPHLSYSYGNGYYTARQQRLALERIKAQKTKVFLRNPFGDLWRVAPGNIQVDRVAGVGRSEFVDVQIPYEEVKG